MSDLTSLKNRWDASAKMRDMSLASDLVRAYESELSALQEELREEKIYAINCKLGNVLPSEGEIQKAYCELKAKLAEREWVPLLERLIANEVNSVTLVHPNPDFEGTAEMIYVNGDLTGFRDQFYHGDTRVECFQKAVAELFPAFPTDEGK